MVVPVTVIASTRPAERLLRHVDRDRVTVVGRRSTAHHPDARHVVASGRFVVSEPEVYFRSPGCPCCAVREDLVDALVRATRRAELPERIVVFVDLDDEDLLIAISTILSSFEIIRRCALDHVVLDVDAVELSTRVAIGLPVVDDRLLSAISVADRIVIDQQEQVTDDARGAVSAALLSRSGFGSIVGSGTPVVGGAASTEAWHGAPDARSIVGDHDQPSTIVLRVDEPLDPDAIDEWLDALVTGHASRLLRIQAALSVAGHEDRTCCYGVRSFATSHSEIEHVDRRSTESVVVICGIGLDADELWTSFRATVAT
ncbi:MAG: GTP-binding protein [Actinomycetota bacterium]